MFRYTITLTVPVVAIVALMLSAPSEGAPPPAKQACTVTRPRLNRTVPFTETCKFDDGTNTSVDMTGAPIGDYWNDADTGENLSWEELDELGGDYYLVASALAAQVRMRWDGTYTVSSAINALKHDGTLPPCIRAGAGNMPELAGSTLFDTMRTCVITRAAGKADAKWNRWQPSDSHAAWLGFLAVMRKNWSPAVVSFVNDNEDHIPVELTLLGFQISYANADAYDSFNDCLTQVLGTGETTDDCDELSEGSVTMPTKVWYRIRSGEFNTYLYKTWQPSDTRGEDGTWLDADSPWLLTTVNSIIDPAGLSALQLRRLTAWGAKQENLGTINFGARRTH